MRRLLCAYWLHTYEAETAPQQQSERLGLSDITCSQSLISLPGSATCNSHSRIITAEAKNGRLKPSSHAGIQDWPGEEPVLAAAYNSSSHQWLVLDHAAMLAVPAGPAADLPAAHHAADQSSRQHEEAAPRLQPSPPPAGSPSEWDLDAVMVKPEPSYEDVGEPFTFIAGTRKFLLSQQHLQLSHSSHGA